MALRFDEEDPARGSIAICSGRVRLGSIRPLAVVGGTYYVWAISRILMGGKSSGSAATLEAAKQQIAVCWREWLDDAELSEITPSQQAQLAALLDQWVAQKVDGDQSS